MRRLWISWVLVSVACASAPIKKPDLLALNQADARVLEGCYDCLLEARTTYARVAVGKARPLVITRLFETEILIALREKELAMDAGPSIARARQLVPELPQATVDGSRVLAMVEAAPPADYGTPRRDLVQFRRDAAAYVSKITDEIAWLQTTTLAPNVRLYLGLALDCGYRSRLRSAPGVAVRATPPRLVVPPDAPPLVVYRNATCVEFDSAALERVTAAVPRFVEATYFLGRNAVALVQQRGDTVKTRALVDAAYKRFPESPSVTYLEGAFNQLIGDCKAALGYYDQTIALRSVHEDALLGRTMCLTFLKRTDEAIAQATQMIDLKTDNITEAFYWRSWNHHFRQELPPARRDIESAKARASNDRIHTLAGIIEHDQDDLDPAELDLKIARGLSGGNRNCVAAWYLGLVYMKRERWVPSAEMFDQSMSCYEQNVAESEAGLRKIRENPNLDEEFRAKQIAGFEAAIIEDRRQYHASAFNAANHYARGGVIDKARILIEIAAKDPALAARVADLRRAIGGGEV